MLAAGGAFVLAVVVARWRGGSTRSVCWIAVPTYFLLTWGSWNARAQSLALLLFVLLIALLIRDAHSPSRRVFLRVPLLVLWANIHGTALSGRGARRPLGRHVCDRAPQAASAGMGASIGSACRRAVACLFASPYAASLPSYYETMLFNSGFRSFVTEWSPTAASVQTAPFFLLAFLTVWLIGRNKERLLPVREGPACRDASNRPADDPAA